MTEQQIVAFALKPGPWAGFAAALLYIVVNKLGPQWMTAYWDERKARSKSEAGSYERLFAQQEKTLSFISSATEAIHSMTRSLDGNTQQVFRLGESIERGGRCPLPDCPFIGKEK